jgi:hypothetical protein
MTLLWIVLVLSVLALISAFFVGDNGAGFSVGVLGAIGILIAGVMLLVLGLGRHYGRINCHQFGATSGYNTRFVIYSKFDSGECLVQQKDGKWIPRDQLRDFQGSP